MHSHFSLVIIFSIAQGELLEIAKPFKDDPGKQERFELFLKEKFKGGLRTIDFGGVNNMSEAVRARERLDFEAAAEAIQKAKLAKESNLSSVQLMEFSAAGGMQFTSGGLEVYFSCDNSSVLS